MDIDRFSSSGLAAARVDALKEAGVDARVSYEPRALNDPAPFVVRPVYAGRALAAFLSVLPEDGG